jgi:hypothetical protein
MLVFDDEAMNLLRNAEFNYAVADVIVLGDDLAAICEEDHVGVAEAARILLSRIGGLRNLQGYMDCLMAGTKHKQWQRSPERMH